MNGTTHLKGFKDDTWINGIGDLFRKKDSKQWGINLSIYPSKDFLVKINDSKKLTDKKRQEIYSELVKMSI